MLPMTEAMRNSFPDEILTDNETSIVDVSYREISFDITNTDFSPGKFWQLREKIREIC